jgi:hypothetical protein
MKQIVCVPLKSIARSQKHIGVKLRRLKPFIGVFKVKNPAIYIISLIGFQLNRGEYGKYNSSSKNHLKSSKNSRVSHLDPV